MMIYMQLAIFLECKNLKQNFINSLKGRFMKKSTIIVISTVIIAVIVGASILLLVINRPNPEIISHDGWQIGNTYYVEVTVKNKGASGWVKVYAQIDAAGQIEKQETRVSLEKGEIMPKTFLFNINFPGDAIGQDLLYTTWAVAD